MSTSSVSFRMGLGRKVTMLVLGALIACAGAFAFAAPAKAVPFDTTLDNGQINLGFAFKGETVLPAPGEIAPGSPLPDLWGGGGGNEPTLNIEGDLDGSDVTIAANDFQTPIWVVPNPLDQSPVPITLRATDEITGTYNDTTGELNLAAPLEVRVLVGLGNSPPAPGDYCQVDLGTMNFTTNATAENKDFVGTPFTNGIDGDGALTGTFIVTDDSVPKGDLVAADCEDVDTVSKGKGSLWLSHGISSPDAFKTTLDNGQINLGFAFKGESVLPAPGEIAPGSPLPDLWGGGGGNEPTLNIEGELTNGNVTIQPNQFQTPIWVVPNPLDQSPVPITLRATDEITGTYDSGTGELNLAAPIEVRVLVGLGDSPPAPGDYCQVDLGTMAFTSNATVENKDFVGTPFTNGITGDGAITGTFIVTDDSVPKGDLVAADCEDVDTVSKGKGSLWMSHGIDTPADRPDCPEFTEGFYPDCQPIPCPEGYSGNEPDCTLIASANITQVAIRPARSAMRAGQRARLRLAVVNRGNAPKVVTVQIRSRTRGVRVGKQVRLRAKPGVTWQPFVIAAHRRARGRAVIVAGGIAGAKNGKALVKVHPLRRRR